MSTITVLMDNMAVYPGTRSEHGLSFLIEGEAGRLLFDTGKTGLFLGNAAAMGASLSDIRALVLSHGHYDHTGGLRRLLAETSFRGPLWTGPSFFDPKWSSEPGNLRFIGADFDDDSLGKYGVVHQTVSCGEGSTVSREIAPGAFAVNGFPRIHACETVAERMVVDRGGTRMHDDFRDEICLVLPKPDGLSMVVGCAHPGLMNMMGAVEAHFGQRVRRVFGGSHLVEADEGRVTETIAYLKERGVELAALGHCTGDTAMVRLSCELPAFRALATGARFDL